MSEDSLPMKADLVLIDLGLMLQSAGLSLPDVFTVMDQDDDSTISPDEFRAGLFKLGIAELDEGEINRVIDAIDLNGDGQIDLKELQNSFNEHNMPTRIVGEKAGIPQHDGQSMLANTSSGGNSPNNTLFINPSSGKFLNIKEAGICTTGPKPGNSPAAMFILSAYTGIFTRTS